MRRYLIRQNCEYSTIVEASDAKEARSMAEEIPLNDWDVAWAGIEIELEEPHGLDRGQPAIQRFNRALDLHITGDEHPEEVAYE